MEQRNVINIFISIIAYHQTCRRQSRAKGPGGPLHFEDLELPLQPARLLIREGPLRRTNQRHPAPLRLEPELLAALIEKEIGPLAMPRNTLDQLTTFLPGMRWTLASSNARRAT